MHLTVDYTIKIFLLSNIWSNYKTIQICTASTRWTSLLGLSWPLQVGECSQQIDCAAQGVSTQHSVEACVMESDRGKAFRVLRTPSSTGTDCKPVEFYLVCSTQCFDFICQWNILLYFGLRHRFASNCLHLAPLFGFAGTFILKMSASVSISSGRPVSTAKARILSSEVFRTARLTLILLHGTDKLNLDRLKPPLSVPRREYDQLRIPAVSTIVLHNVSQLGPFLAACTAEFRLETNIIVVSLWHIGLPLPIFAWALERLCLFLNTRVQVFRRGLLCHATPAVDLDAKVLRIVCW